MSESKVWVEISWEEGKRQDVDMVKYIQSEVRFTWRPTAGEHACALIGCVLKTMVFNQIPSLGKLEEKAAFPPSEGAFLPVSGRKPCPR